MAKSFNKLEVYAYNSGTKPSVLYMAIKHHLNIIKIVAVVSFHC